MGRDRGQRSWTDHDTALWHACEAAFDLLAGRPPLQHSQVLAPFPEAFAADERFWASGPFELAEMRAHGDGSYMQNTGFFFATGAAGLAATAAVAATRAAGNSARRNAAAAALVPRWTTIDHGVVFVSFYGFYLHTPRGVFRWSFDAVTAGEMVGPRLWHLYGDSDNGPVSWILGSDWAELAFVTWALRKHPRHPQLLEGGWLPPDWLNWCVSQGHGTRLQTPALTSM